MSVNSGAPNPVIPEGYCIPEENLNPLKWAIVNIDDVKEMIASLTPEIIFTHARKTGTELDLNPALIRAANSTKEKQKTTLN